MTEIRIDQFIPECFRFSVGSVMCSFHIPGSSLTTKRALCILVPQHRVPMEIQIWLYSLAFPFLAPSRVACHGRRASTQKARQLAFCGVPQCLVRVIFSSLLFKTAYFTFSFQGCLPLFSPNPQNNLQVHPPTSVLASFSSESKPKCKSLAL